MTNPKRLGLTLVLLLSFLYPASAYAQTTVQQTIGQLPNPNPLPTDTFGYWVKRHLSEPFTILGATVCDGFSMCKGATALIYIAEASTRISELQALHNQGNDKYDDDLTSDYQSKMDAANNSLDHILDNETRINVAATLAAATTQHLIVLQRVLASAPPQAQASLLNAISKSQNGTLHAAQNLADRTKSAVTIQQVTCTISTDKKPTCTTTTTTVTKR